LLLNSCNEGQQLIYRHNPKAPKIEKPPPKKEYADISTQANAVAVEQPIEEVAAPKPQMADSET